MVKEFSVFNRLYFLDENGDVYRTSGKKMTRLYGREYPYYQFRQNGKNKRIFCHRLVAELFIPNPDNLPQVNHIDGNKNNCCINNLEWVTNSQNQMHSRYTLHNHTGYADTPVICLETNKLYISTREAWRDTGIGYSHISECVHGKRKTAGGYHWRNAE